jgi:hypothetical protein
MPFDPKAELYEIADAIQDAIACERAEARKAAQDVQAVVSRHRGMEGQIAGVQERYVQLRAAVIAWLEAPKAEEAKARAAVGYLATGDFELSPDCSSTEDGDASDFELVD